MSTNYRNASRWQNNIYDNPMTSIPSELIRIFIFLYTNPSDMNNKILPILLFLLAIMATGCTQVPVHLDDTNATKATMLSLAESNNQLAFKL